MELFDEKCQQLEDAQDNLLEYKEDLRALDEKLGPVKEEELLDYAKARDESAFDKYCKLFEYDKHLIQGRK